MTNVRTGLVRLFDVRTGRQCFEEGVAGYGRLSVLLLPRIRGAEEFYLLRPDPYGREADERIISRERVKVDGGFAVAVHDHVEEIARFVRAELVADASYVCMIEDVLARRGDRYLAASECEVRYVDEAVFHVFTAVADDTRVEKCMRRSRLTFGHSLCVLADFVSVAGDPLSRESWPQETLNEVAARTIWAAISVSGGQAFVLVRLTPPAGVASAAAGSAL